MAILPEFDVTQAPANSGWPVAVGDGTADDSPAIQDRIDRATANPGGGSVYLPPGSYRIAQTLRIPAADSEVTIRGAGSMSFLKWDVDDDLFRWDARCFAATVRDFWVTAQQNIGANHAMLRATQGVSNFTARSLRLHVANSATQRSGSGIVLGEPGPDPPPSLSGSVRLEDLELWFCKGDAIRLTDLTDVWVRNCRVVAGWRPATTPPRGSNGLHLGGNNGGVWVENCDFSEFETGILVDRSMTKVGRQAVLRKNNRELFVVGGACDGGVHGMVVNDSSFVTVTGAWLASNDAENLKLSTVGSPSVTMTGGMVFNAGTWLQPKPSPLRSHGIVVESGTLVLTGTLVDNNAGIGLKVGALARGATVSGCLFRNNWTNAFELLQVGGSIAGNTVKIGLGGQPAIPPLFAPMNFVIP